MGRRGGGKKKAEKKTAPSLDKKENDVSPNAQVGNSSGSGGSKPGGANLLRQGGELKKVVVIDGLRFAGGVALYLKRGICTT